jgi:hypothetical protein
VLADNVELGSSVHRAGWGRHGGDGAEGGVRRVR